MRISQLIRQLESIRSDAGDLEVQVLTLDERLKSHFSFHVDLAVDIVESERGEHPVCAISWSEVFNRTPKKGKVA